MWLTTVGSAVFQHLWNQKARSHFVSPCGFKHLLPIFMRMSWTSFSIFSTCDIIFSKWTSPLALIVSDSSNIQYTAHENWIETQNSTPQPNKKQTIEQLLTQNWENSDNHQTVILTVTFELFIVMNFTIAEFFYSFYIYLKWTFKQQIDSRWAINCGYQTWTKCRYQTLLTVADSSFLLANFS